jgi:cytochrome d ubiquinol oxidase subunit I
VDGVLPTALSVSHLSASTELLITLAGFVTFYSVLFIVEMGLMLKYIRKGPFLGCRGNRGLGGAPRTPFAHP